MSKILITSLGTGVKDKNDSGYRLAEYELDGKRYAEKIIAKVLYNHIKFDKIFMIGTARSMWDAVYDAFGGEDEKTQLKLYEKQEKGSIAGNDLIAITNLWKNRFAMAGSKTNLASIKSFINRAKSKISIFSDSDSKLTRLVSKDLIRFIQRMDKDNLSNFQLEMAKWFNENKNYAMSYIALAESVVSKVCELEGLDLEDETDRNDAKRRLKNDSKCDSLFKKYKTPNRVRNNIAHQLNDRKGSVISDINNLKQRIIDIERQFKLLER